MGKYDYLIVGSSLISYALFAKLMKGPTFFACGG